MKGILLAGGRGTRLKPFTTYVNKHLLPLLDKPVIQYAIETLKTLDVDDIAVVLGDFQCGDIVEFLGDGSKFDVKICYYFQGEAKGIAHAVNCAKDFILNTNTEGFYVYLADNIFKDGLEFFKWGIENRKILDLKFPDCGILFKDVNDPERFGVPIMLFEYGFPVKVLKIIEKPKPPTPTNYALTGCYYFSRKFFNYYKELKPSARGEYEITDIINMMIERLNNIYWDIYRGYWSDAGTFESLWETAKRLKEK